MDEKAKAAMLDHLADCLANNPSVDHVWIKESVDTGLWKVGIEFSTGHGWDVSEPDLAEALRIALLRLDCGE